MTHNTLKDGTILNGKYTIKRHIASGGFGNTYEAVNEFGERVAIKEFFLKGINQRDGDSTSVSVSNDENRTQFTQQRAKFKQEAMHLRGLLSAHVVKVQSYFEENGTSYYVMNYIDGDSLSSRLERTGQPIAETEARRILDHILEALGEAHQKGIYHLDLKPGNIMLDNQGNTLLIDFGASKQTDNTGSLSTLPPALTKEYAPLEQLEGNVGNIGPWTDFYSLGATLYRILTNQNPPSYTAILTEGASAFRFTAAVPTDMRELITWMMQPNRRNRPQTVEEIRQRFTLPQQRGEETTVGVNEKPQTGDVTKTNEEDTQVSTQPNTLVDRERLKIWLNAHERKNKAYAVKRLGSKYYQVNELLQLRLYTSDLIKSPFSSWINLGKALDAINVPVPEPPTPPKQGESGGNLGGILFFLLIGVVILFVVLAKSCGTSTAETVDYAIDATVDSAAAVVDTAAAVSDVTTYGSETWEGKPEEGGGGRYVGEYRYGSGMEKELLNGMMVQNMLESLEMGIELAMG